MPATILAQSPLSKAAPHGAKALGGCLLSKVKAARAPLCRPSGWIALWRRIGNLSVLNRRVCVA